MRRTATLILLLLPVLLAYGCQLRSTGSGLYFVDTYDESRDPFADMDAASKIASAEYKHILLQVGGNWCSWCHRMTEFFEDRQSVRSAIVDNYVLVKINYSKENPNEEFLKQYPAIKGYPHLLVLDAGGALLHSQDTAELEEGDSYSEERLIQFLQRWQPQVRRDDAQVL